MHFKRNLAIASHLHPISFIPFLNCIILVGALLILSSPLLMSNSTAVLLPRTITSDTLTEHTLTVFITSEDLIYVKNQIMTDKELKKFLLTKSQKQPILIKADGRSSLTRTIDIWNICRDAGFEKVNIATTRN